MWVGRRVALVTVGSLVATFVVGLAGAAPATATGTGDGLTAYYFNDARTVSDVGSSGFAGVTDALATDPQSKQPTCHTGTVETVNFNWGTAGPGGSCNINNWGAFYTGYLLAPATGTITFKVSIDDATQLKLDGTQVLASLRENGGQGYTGTFNTSAGKIHKLDLWFRDFSAGAMIKFEWKYGTMTTFEVVPKSNLGTSITQFDDEYLQTCSVGIGLSADCPAYSIQEILDLYESATATSQSSRVINGVTTSAEGNKYWLLVAGVATEVLVQWDRRFNGGGYVLMLKGGPRSNFSYDHPAWTDPNWIQRATDPKRVRATGGDVDAKYPTFNYTKLSSMMAVFPSWNTDTVLVDYSSGPDVVMPVGDVTTWNEFNWLDTVTVKSAKAQAGTAVSVFGNTETTTAPADYAIKIGAATRTVMGNPGNIPTNIFRFPPRYFGPESVDASLSGKNSWFGVNFNAATTQDGAAAPMTCGFRVRWGGWHGSAATCVLGNKAFSRDTPPYLMKNDPIVWGLGTNERGVTANGDIQGIAQWQEGVYSYGYFAIPRALFPLTWELESGYSLYGYPKIGAGPRWEIWGKADTATAIANFATPANVTASMNGSTSATVTWDTVASATEYVIQYRDTSQSWNQARTVRLVGATASTNSATIGGLRAGVQYEFRVSARAATSPMSLSWSKWSANSPAVGITFAFGSGATAVPVAAGETVTLSTALGDSDSATVTATDPLTALNFNADSTTVVVVDASVGTLSLDTATIVSALLSVPTGYGSYYPAFIAGKLSGSRIAFQGKLSDINKALALVKYARPAGSTAAGTIKVTFSDPGTPDGAGTDWGVRFNPTNGHYYEFYNNGSDVKWYTARCLARYAAGATVNSQSSGTTGYCTGTTERTYQGMRGYLVTITSPAESAFVKAIQPSGVTAAWWAGGTDDVIYTGAGQSVSGSGADKWMWADGPELGLLFTTGQDASAQTPTGVYENWRRTSSPREPNDSSGESVLEVIHNDANAVWNDESGAVDHQFMLFEYSPSRGGLNATLTLTKTLTVADKPSVTSPTESAGVDTATITATIASVGSPTSSIVVYYGTDSSTVTGKTSATATPTPNTIDTATGTPVTATLTGLKPGTTYYWQMSVTNASGETSTALQDFTTANGTPRIGQATTALVDTASATVGAAVTANSSSSLAVSLKYGTSSNTLTSTGTASPATVTGTSQAQVTGNLTGLSPSTRYYYRFDVGTESGTVASFTTPAASAPALNPNTVQTATLTPPGANTPVTYSAKVGPTHGETFYVDFRQTPAVDAAYVGYRITNTGSTDMKNVWVSLSNFSGGVVSLANPADANFMISSIPVGATRTAYFLLKASETSTVAQTHDVRVTVGDPRLQGAVELSNSSFTFDKVLATTAIAANDVTSVTYSTASPVIGGLLSITVKGTPGVVGAGDGTGDGSIIWLSPTTSSTWPTGALRLEGVKVDIGVVSGAAGCSAQYLEQLLITSAQSCHSQQDYTVTYTFRAVGASPSSFTVAPSAQTASGSGYGHTDLAGSKSVQLTVVPQQTVQVTSDLTTSNDTTTVGATTYTKFPSEIDVTSQSSLTSQLQQIEVNLDTTTAGTTSYIDTSTATLTVFDSAKNETTTSSVPVQQDLNDPSKYVFTGPFNVSGSQTATITYNTYVSTNGAATSSSNGTTGAQDIGNGPGTETTSTLNNNASPPTATEASSLAPIQVSVSTSDVSYFGASIAGLVYNADSQTALGFRYSTSSNMFNSTALAASPETATGVSPLRFTALVNGLSAGSTYYVQAIVNGQLTGEVFKFATPEYTDTSFRVDPAPMPTLNLNPNSGGTTTITPSISGNPSITENAGSLQWSVTSGSLPPGMTLDTTTGTVSGTPTTAGNYNFTLGATTTGTSAASTVSSHQNYNLMVLPETATAAVTARDASQVLHTSAVMNGDGDYLPFGDEIYIDYWVDTDSVAELDAAKTRVLVATSIAAPAQRISWAVVGLQPGTRYAYRIIGGGMESNLIRFTTETQTVTPPTIAVTVSDSVTVTTTTASVKATGSNLSGGDTLQLLVSTSPSLASPREISLGSAQGAAAEDIEYVIVNLDPDTLYYVKLLGGPVESSVRSFRTSGGDNGNSNNNNSNNNGSGGGGGGGGAPATTTTGGNDPKVEDEIKNNVKFGDPTTDGSVGGGTGGAGGSTGTGAGSSTGTGAGGTGTGGSSAGGSTGSGTGGSGTGSAGAGAASSGISNVSPRPGSPLFVPISGLPAGSIVTVPSATQLPKGVNGVFLSGNAIQVIPSATFSGKVSVPMTVTVGSTTVTLNVPLTVNPATVTEIQTLKNASNKTLISWDPVANAVRYQVSVAGVILCTTANNACLFHGILGPKSQITVVSLGNDGTASRGATAGAKFVKAIRVGTIKFNTNSSTLDKLDRRVLAQLAKNMRVWGFQTVYVVGYTDGQGGSKGSIPLSKARAEGVLKILKANLSAKFKLKAMGEKNPIASNKTPEGQAKNRRVEVLVR